MDKSAQKLAPSRRIEVRPNHAGPGYLLVAIERRPDAGHKETLLNLSHAPTDQKMAELWAEAVSRCVEALTGVAYAYPNCGVANG